MPQRCFKCNGSGRWHNYKGIDPNYPNCGHFVQCTGCTGSGAIPDKASRCPRCNANGEYHDYSGLDPAYPNCGHWKNCGTCNTKGWLPRALEKDEEEYVETLLLSVSPEGEELLGTVHWGYAEDPQVACDIANGEAKRRARRIRTCVTTTAIPATETCTPGGPKGWQAWAVSANHRGSCLDGIEE
jgi:DnaJ-class molecular chaperone